MASMWICILLLFGAALGDDSCPSPTELAPCTCDGEGINCMQARNVEEIKRAFRSKFKYGGIRSVWIQETPLTYLPPDIFGGIKIQQLFLEVNNLNNVDINAFMSSRTSMFTLSLFGNKITTLPYRNFHVFERLGTLNLARNLIETIPDNAFESRSLAALFLAQNKISHIGQNAFSRLPRLARLELTFNQITTLGPLSLAMPTHAPQLQINVAANKISQVSPTAFNGTYPTAVIFSQNQLTSLKSDAFGSLVTKIVQVNGGFLEVSANPFSCRGCDNSWLVLNRNILAQKVVGFACTDGRRILDLTRDNIGC